MNDFVVMNAVIEKADILFNHDVFLDASLTLNYGDSGFQSFGGYTLFNRANPHGGDWAGLFISRCMEIAGVEEWKRMPGRPLRVRRADDRGKIVEIGHIVKDDWFDPKEEYAKYHGSTS